jgi:hypothetical protein
MKKKLIFILGILLVLGPLGFSVTSWIIKRSQLTYNIPETPETKEIMRTIERAYDIEVEAAYTFNIKKFPTVFINDPRFPVSPGTLEIIKELTNDPSLESAGWLDYKEAFYSWRIEDTLHAEAVKEKAKQENRALSKEERDSLMDPQGRSAPARAQGPTRTTSLSFMSIEINEDVAIVILDDGTYKAEVTLVFVDGSWYIAGFKGISLNI